MPRRYFLDGATLFSTRSTVHVQPAGIGRKEGRQWRRERARTMRSPFVGTSSGLVDLNVCLRAAKG